MIIYVDDRGYLLECLPDGRYRAGCRKPMTRDEALAHWGGKDYEDPARGAEFCAAIERNKEITALPEGLRELSLHDGARLPESITALPEGLRELFLHDGARLPESIAIPSGCRIYR